MTARVAAGRAIFGPIGDAKIAMIDRRDLAAVAALAPTEDTHEGRTYVLTGPEAITYHDVAAQRSQVLGKIVDFVDVPDEAAIGAAMQAGAPEWLAHGAIEVHRQVQRGIADQTSDVVRVQRGDRRQHSDRRVHAGDAGLLARRRRHGRRHGAQGAPPRRMFVRTAVAPTVLSFVPDVTFGFDAGSAAILIALHTVAAAIVVNPTDQPHPRRAT